MTCSQNTSGGSDVLNLETCFDWVKGRNVPGSKFFAFKSRGKYCYACVASYTGTSSASTKRDDTNVYQMITKVEPTIKDESKLKWTRVRHVPAGNTWHPSKDYLVGTEEYGDPKDDTKAWSIKWDKS